jgi:hypothetical protein
MFRFIYLPPVFDILILILRTPEVRQARPAEWCASMLPPETVVINGDSIAALDGRVAFDHDDAIADCNYVRVSAAAAHGGLTYA